MIQARSSRSTLVKVAGEDLYRVDEGLSPVAEEVDE